MKTELLQSLDFKPTPPAKTARASAPCFRLEIDNDLIAWLTFDTPGSAANIWNLDTLREFGEHLENVSRQENLHALVIRSAKDKIMIAGADLKALRRASVKKVEALIDLGQSTFNRLASLPLPKIALIHGACVGGGFEMALACDVRLASDSDSTRIGLPETQIGLVPAWGGSTRLPRLIGLPAALKLIVTGSLLKPREAKRLGIVEAVMPREHLEAAARKMIAAGIEPRALRLAQHLWTLPGLRHLLARSVRQSVQAKTRGHYRAPLRAIEVATRASVASLPVAMQLEKHAIMDLALSPETGHLIDLFFRKEEASKKPWPRGVALPVHDVAVIGAGVMGSGIAHWLATHGHRVVMQDVSTESLARGLTRVHELLDEGLKRHAITHKEKRDALDRLTPDHSRAPLTHHQMVIEAATEDISLKKKIFLDLATRTSADTILATNTSALSVSELARVLPHPERVIGLHFFNPVHRMPLVEIITTHHTTDDVIATAVSFVQRLGKTPVVVRDSPGFIVNRILMPYLMEAVRLHESGLPAPLIDEAMLEFGMPMGPMRLLDEIGLDVASHVGRTLIAAFPERLPKLDTLDRMVSEGKLGKKSGAGFYEYPQSERRKAAWSPADLDLIDTVQHRLALLLANEASRCAHEGIAANAHVIDLAMILGTGYPAFRGGPLEWLHGFGDDTAAMELQSLAASTPQPNAFSPDSLFQILTRS